MQDQALHWGLSWNWPETGRHGWFSGWTGLTCAVSYCCYRTCLLARVQEICWRAKVVALISADKEQVLLNIWQCGRAEGWMASCLFIDWKGGGIMLLLLIRWIGNKCICKIMLKKFKKDIQIFILKGSLEDIN